MKKITNLDRDALAQRIRSLDALSADEKSALLELLNQKKYGLVWENKPEKVEEELRTHIPVFEEVKERFVKSDNPEAPNHILIEGDNLQALTTLAYTHEGKIDLIYIDPPYNTGNKDFKYNDSFVDSDDGYRHSMWLSFMEKRLRIARRLLSDKGVIFISIDDNEQANLKLLCDEVFGENNFVAKFDWRKKTGANDAKDIAVITETVLLYAKSRNICLESKIWARDNESIDKNRYKLEDEYIEERGRFYYDTLDRGGLQYSDSMNYGITMPDGKMLYPNGRSEFLNDGWIWKWSEQKVRWGIENGYIIFANSKKNKHTSYTIKYKVYEKVDNDGKPRMEKGRAFLNLITSPINQQGNSELADIFNGVTPFSNPKPIGLVHYLFKTTLYEYCVLLDFFAGSGTTLHATMQLNAEDGGNRQCILVTNNENKICEEVTYERNRRVIQGYTNSKGEWVDGLKDNNLRYYKVNLVNRENTSENRQNLMQACADLLCIKENVYTESQFGAKKVQSKYLRFFENTNGDSLLIIFLMDSRLVDYVNETVATMPDNGKRIKTYVYSESDYPYSDDFEPVAARLELVAMPAAMRNALRNVLPDPYQTPILDGEENTLADGEINFNDLSQD